MSTNAKSMESLSAAAVKYGDIFSMVYKIGEKSSPRHGTKPKVYQFADQLL